MIRPTLIDLNPVELKYSSFMISLNKCTENCNVFSPKICVLKEAKDINVRAFNLITYKNEAKAVTKHIPFDCKYKFDSTVCNSNEKWNNKACQCEYKYYCMWKKIIVAILAPVFLRTVSI